MFAAGLIFFGKKEIKYVYAAEVVKLANTQDLGSCAARLVGSTPALGIIKNRPIGGF